MAFNKQQFKDDFYSAIFYAVHFQESTDYKIQWIAENANSDTMKPEGDYISLSMIAGPSKIGQNAFVNQPKGSNSNQKDITSVKNITVSVKVFYDNYADIVDKIVLATSLPDFLALLHKKKDVDFSINTLVSGFTYAITLQGTEFNYTALPTDSKQDIADNLTDIINSATWSDFEAISNTDSIKVLSQTDYIYSVSTNIISNLVQRFVDISIRRVLQLTDVSETLSDSLDRVGIIDFQIATTTRLHDVIEDYIEHVTMSFNGKTIIVQ